MECSRTGIHDFHLASRKAEEAALRRFHAVEWLESLLGSLGMSNQPSEREFISCLRNGSILCNAINKIQPGAVPKVVENYSHLKALNGKYQPAAAYQYFENVRNFLVAIGELKLPAFEASDLERDNLESGSVCKVVDCILALKAFHEGKQASSSNGFHKHAKSPPSLHSANKIHTRGPLDSCRRLDCSAPFQRQTPMDRECKKVVELITKLLVEHCDVAKENIDENLLTSFCEGHEDPHKFRNIISSFISKQIQHKFLEEGKISRQHNAPMPLRELTVSRKSECCRTCSRHGHCDQIRLLNTQQKELLDLKDLLGEVKESFKSQQLQLLKDLREIENQVKNMSIGAVAYRKVVMENRKLYNMVQDLKGSIRVFCRVRPTFSRDARSVIDFIGEDGSLVILDAMKAQRKTFQFNRIFGPASTQADVYGDTQPLIRSVMDGYNVCIFAYGQTGSGKTYTMNGPRGGSTVDMGINYLALHELFLICDKRKEAISYSIHVQMIEIYNEQIRDLLAENSSTTKLEIRSSNGNGLNLPDATMHPVKSTADVLKLMELGEVNRAVSSTAMNNQSSRSHSVLTVHVRGKDTSGGTVRSCLHLVDLAGSERVDKSEVVGDRLKEAQYINKSLSCLGDVISALALKNTHVPYRNSKLTLLLQDSLGGQAKALMFAHLSPEDQYFGETMSTLNFAQRVSTVEFGPARAQRESGEVIQLKAQVDNLKRALADKERENNVANIISGKLIPAIDRTPPRARRLSIENMNTSKSEKVRKLEDRKGERTPALTRVRRLSLEGSRNPRNNKNDSKATTQMVSKEKLTHDAGAGFEVLECMEEGESSSEAYHLTGPLSPTGFYQKQAVNQDSRLQSAQIQMHQIPEAPELNNIPGRTIQMVTNGEATGTEDPLASGKKSQIRKSLRTIGKLINGSDKRNQKAASERRSPLKGKTNINEPRSPPVTSSVRASRRQSLTGIQASGTEGSRMRSIEGRQKETGSKVQRKSTTPPPISRESAAMSARRRL